ncbi:MAG: lipoate--protein ligase family protein [Ignavibacteria bacterium]|nr:lipoate--protein ligase family protein [Ignavibacteria bacterium]
MITHCKRWEYIESGENDGRFNMDFDLMLAEKCRNLDTAFLRLYTWKPYAISLGYNQNKILNEIELDIPKCRAEKIDIVRRPTGGRAVLHAEELTYSVVLKSRLPVSEINRHISEAIIYGLKKFSPGLREVSLTKDKPDLLGLIRKGNYKLCFSTQVKNEINWQGKKLVGSAQRSFGDVILQHGSILTGTYHKNIVEYLNLQGEERIRLRNELDSKTVSISEITGEKVNHTHLAECILEGFQNYLQISFSKINRLNTHFTIPDRLESSLN